MSNQTNHKPVHVVLNKPATAVQVLSLAEAVEAAISAHVKTFASPSPSMADFQSAISALAAAQTDTKTRAKGAVQTRDAKLTIVEVALAKLRAYVEGVANADPANAAAIANSAGMALRKQPRTPEKNAVNVKAGKNSGAVGVTARVGTRQKQSHEWEYSTDGGKSWLQAPPTTQAKTTIAGLTPGVMVLVRHRAVTRTGVTDWSDAASMVVA